MIGVFDMPKDEANQLVVKLSKKGNRIDWHYVGGRVVMKMLPPKASVNFAKLNLAISARDGMRESFLDVPEAVTHDTRNSKT